MAKTFEQMSDEELIQAFREGDSRILDYLMEKYKGIVLRRARAMFLVGGDTDDLIQEGMIGLFKAVRDYRPEKEASFQTFARLCIERQMYTAVQNSNRKKHEPLNTYVSLNGEDPEIHVQQDWRDNPETILLDQENFSQLQEKIQSSLSKMEDQVLQEYLQGYSYEQIAEHLGKTVKTVDNALRRIRTKIKYQLG